jgi:hypothetical protein
VSSAVYRLKKDELIMGLEKYVPGKQ